MSDQLDLALPSTVPASAAWRNKSIPSSAAALYSLVDLTDAELKELQKICESGCESEMQEGATVSLAPHPLFVDQPLRAVFDYQLELAKEDVYYPTFFIVAVDRDWRANGVLLVTLDDGDEPEGKVDYFRMKAKHSGLMFANLEVGNSDWMEEKESYEIKPGQGDKNTDDEGEDDNEEEEEGEDGPDAPSRFDDPGSPISGPIPPTRPHPLTGGDYKGIYIISGLNPTEVINKLTPGASYLDIKPANYHIRLQAIIPASSPDPVAEALSLHTSRCASNPFLYKLLFLLVDTMTPEIDGVVLVCTGGVVKGDGIPAGAIQRAHFSALKATQDLYCSIEIGVRVWAPRDLTIGVFTYDTGSQDLGKIASLLDPAFKKRIMADERILFVPAHEPGDTNRAKLNTFDYSFETALKWWTRWCWEERFRQKFPKNFFICADNGNVEEKGVLLVKIEWDGDTSGEIERMDHVELHGTAEVWRVPVREAYQTLKDVIEGTRKWEGSRLE